MAEHEHAGHRQRLYAKLESGKLENHEYLEALLFNAIPRRNTNEIAHRLLSRFGSFSGVFKASVDELKTVDGVGDNVANYLFLIGEIFRRVDKEEKACYPRVYVKSEFEQYLKNKAYVGETKECFDCYFLDRSGVIKCWKRFESDSEYSVSIKPELLNKLLANIQPFALVVAHNHVKGECLPSRQDDQTTSQLQMLCSIQNILLCDHYIVSPVGVYSYHSSGRLQEIAKKFAIKQIVKQFDDHGWYSDMP